MKNIKNKIPNQVIEIIETLQKAGFEAQIVGGSVRDLVIGLIPKDWDINTNAKPEEILKLFPDSFYENEFGTVGIKIRDVSGETETTEIVEVTPYRKEGKYLDGRHPESVSFDATLIDDLKRRDFTVNAIAYDPIKDIIKDIEGTMSFTEVANNDKGFLSLKDIKDKVIRSVGNPKDRFNEDYLRMLRAVRFSAQLGFTIEKETEKAIIELSSSLKSVSRERVRDELIKIFISPVPMVGFLMLEYVGLLKDIMPELLMGKGMYQTKNHKYDVYGHLLRCMQHAADKNYPLEMRIAALLHDIAKPHTARWVKETNQNSFHGHEVVGEKVSREILNRLKFPQELVAKVTKLIRWHMFNSDPDQVTMSAVRRMIVNVGRDNIWDLMNLRFCDRVGSGRPVEDPHRLRRYFAMIEEALTQPTDLKMLKIDGRKIMEVTHETPGPKIGFILNALMGQVLDDPTLNTEEKLVTRVTELAKLEIATLKSMADHGKEEMQDKEIEKEKEIRKKFKV
jgi:poly(A) polymerase/tRNA nucleotidyltransferase (CCA-adding enzyme)